MYIRKCSIANISLYITIACHVFTPAVEVLLMVKDRWVLLYGSWSSETKKEHPQNTSIVENKTIFMTQVSNEWILVTSLPGIPCYTFALSSPSRHSPVWGPCAAPCWANLCTTTFSGYKWIGHLTTLRNTLRRRDNRRLGLVSCIPWGQHSMIQTYSDSFSFFQLSPIFLEFLLGSHLWWLLFNNFGDVKKMTFHSATGVLSRTWRCRNPWNWHVMWPSSWARPLPYRMGPPVMEPFASRGDRTWCALPPPNTEKRKQNEKGRNPQIETINVIKFLQVSVNFAWRIGWFTANPEKKCGPKKLAQDNRPLCQRVGTSPMSIMSPMVCCLEPSCGFLWLSCRRAHGFKHVNIRVVDQRLGGWTTHHSLTTRLQLYSQLPNSSISMLKILRYLLIVFFIFFLLLHWDWDRVILKKPFVFWLKQQLHFFKHHFLSHVKVRFVIQCHTLCSKIILFASNIQVVLLTKRGLGPGVPPTALSTAAAVFDGLRCGHGRVGVPVPWRAVPDQFELAKKSKMKLKRSDVSNTTFRYIGFEC